jgi:hypothetical protein
MLSISFLSVPGGGIQGLAFLTPLMGHMGSKIIFMIIWQLWNGF